LEQKELAAAAEVTESYISQLLNRRKLPPAPDRTDIYDKLSKVLKLSKDELAKLAHAQRIETLNRDYEDPGGPLLKETRDLVLLKCNDSKREHVRQIFERQPFGELERLVTQHLLNVVRRVARSELDNQIWLNEVGQFGNKSRAQMRDIILEFLDTDIYNVSNEDCVSFLEPIIAGWDIDLASFDMEISLNQRLASESSIKFGFVEKRASNQVRDEPGLTAFLDDPALSRDISVEELDYLRMLSIKSKRPNLLFYYRALQTFRDPLHFTADNL